MNNLIAICSDERGENFKISSARNTHRLTVDAYVRELLILIILLFCILDIF